MIELVRKRHDGPAWIVIEEVGNSTGSNVRRHADAVALGLWPSRGYELHGYELKASRGDVQKELNDPTKADAVGKFCDYWWLVVEDLKIIDGLVIPETWGVLYPRNKVLRVHRKAPKRADVTPVNRGFAAAMIRRVCEGWVPKREHQALKAGMREQIEAELKREIALRRDTVEGELARLREAVQRFEETSGVAITNRYADGETFPLPNWQIEGIGEAVKVVMEAREARTARFRGRGEDDVVALVEQELAGVERAIANHEWAVANRRSAAEQLRGLIERLKASSESAS